MARWSDSGVSKQESRQSVLMAARKPVGFLQMSLVDCAICEASEAKMELGIFGVEISRHVKLLT
ncbi:MAG: hypothetical protein F6K26_03440 [Moorea sp. SIO2I5]|nr:hypothetical protein [Moorena sp. SIO2I5]